MRYLDEKLGADPEPLRRPPARQLTPAYRTELDAPVQRPRIPASAHGLPAYRGRLGVPAVQSNHDFRRVWLNAWADDSKHLQHVHIDLDLERWNTVMRQLGDGFAAMRPALQQAAENLGKGLADLQQSLRRSGVLPDAPPDDPRARALWMVQHRNTGPRRPTAGQQKRPKRVP